MSRSKESDLSATPLFIVELAVEDLRCHERLRWRCDPGLNLVIGENGSGKTTLLEAVYLMSFGRSFRQARDPFLIRHGREHFSVHGLWHRFGPMHLSVFGTKGGTRLRLQGREVQRRKDISEGFPVLIDAPQGARLVDGAPRERRRWLDGLVMTCFQGMRAYYERYLRAVMQRGRLLRRRQTGDELDAWEYQIVQNGRPISQYRRRLLDELNRALLQEQDLTELPLAVQIKDHTYDEEAWLERLRRKREDDMRSGGLRFGPHCDSVQILYQEREIRSAGSRGQQRLAAIAIKMAECALWRRYRRILPVVLFDDCLEALDRERRRRVLQRLSGYSGQVLMTAPEGVETPSASTIDISVQCLQAGQLKPMTLDPGSGPDSATMEEAA